jgi:DNA (cytosine-5)-methyltransferase 1
MAPTLNCNHEAPYAVYQTAHTLRGEGDGAVFEEGDRTAPLTTGTDPCANILAFDTTQVTSVANRSSPKAVDPCHPLAAGAHAPAIAFDSRMRGAEPAVGREERPPQTMVERTGAIDATKPWNVATSMQVRRLTPRECERLQSFPDDYTLIPNVKIKTVRPEKFDQDFLKYLMRGGSKTQEECMRSFADGPRYKALGNSWCVNNVRWIGERIDAVALINTTQPATNSVAELETT